MATVTYVQFDTFNDDLSKGVHNLNTDTIKLYLTNTAPNVSTMSVKAGLAEIIAENGYPSGGVDIQNTVSTTGGNTTVDFTNASITASGGSFGPFRYAVAYNDTTIDDRLISYYDYGSSVSANDGETVNFNKLTSFQTISKA